MWVLAIIPARLGASRFPGKPLEKLLSMPMIGHCYFRAKIALGRDNVWIATCDDKIRSYSQTIGVKAIDTSAKHTRATGRTAEAPENQFHQTGRTLTTFPDTFRQWCLRSEGKRYCLFNYLPETLLEIAESVDMNRVIEVALRQPHSPSAGQNLAGYLSDFSATQTALGVLPTAAQVAASCVFLASTSANAITGECINVDCGVMPHEILKLPPSFSAVLP